VPPLASGLKLISFESAAKAGSEPKVPRFCIAANVCFICRAKPFNNYLGFAMGLWHKNFQ
jgi:hypothetical protein